MPKGTHRLITLIAMLLLTALACGVPGFPSATPTPAPFTPGDFLTYTIIPPAYTVSLNPGDHVPGAPLQYIGQEGDTYRVRIGGLEAVKRVGDSFAWAGIIAPSVYAEYNLRLTTTLLGPLPVTGGVELTILDWQPLEVAFLPDLSEAVHFGNILVNYNVPAAETLPASTLVYSGVYTQGSQQFARFSGLSAQPYYAQGDSLVWTGQLRENVYVRYNLRVISFDEDNVLLGGTAELWLTEQTYP